MEEYTPIEKLTTATYALSTYKNVRLTRRPCGSPLFLFENVFPNESCSRLFYMNLDEFSEWVEHLKRWEYLDFKIDEMSGMNSETVIHDSPRRKHVCRCIYSEDPQKIYTQVDVWLKGNGISPAIYRPTNFKFRLDGIFEIKQLLNTYIMAMNRVEDFTHVQKYVLEAYDIISYEYVHNSPAQLATTPNIDIKERAIYMDAIPFLQFFDERLFVERWSVRVREDLQSFFKIAAEDLLRYVKCHRAKDFALYVSRRYGKYLHREG